MAFVIGALGDDGKVVHDRLVAHEEQVVDGCYTNHRPPNNPFMAGLNMSGLISGTVFGGAVAVVRVGREDVVLGHFETIGTGNTVRLEGLAAAKQTANVDTEKHGLYGRRKKRCCVYLLCVRRVKPPAWWGQ
jgi:hypothetical protein